MQEKIVREYDQKIPQSQTADKPMAPRGRAKTHSRDTRKTNEAKQPALSSCSVSCPWAFYLYHTMQGPLSLSNSSFGVNLVQSTPYSY